VGEFTPFLPWPMELMNMMFSLHQEMFALAAVMCNHESELEVLSLLSDECRGNLTRFENFIEIVIGHKHKRT
jgi:hypothetical protein